MHLVRARNLVGMLARRNEQESNLSRERMMEGMLALAAVVENQERLINGLLKQSDGGADDGKMLCPGCGKRVERVPGSPFLTTKYHRCGSP